MLPTIDFKPNTASHDRPAGRAVPISSDEHGHNFLSGKTVTSTGAAEIIESGDVFGSGNPLRAKAVVGHWAERIDSIRYGVWWTRPLWRVPSSLAEKRE